MLLPHNAIGNTPTQLCWQVQNMGKAAGVDNFCHLTTATPHIHHLLGLSQLRVLHWEHAAERQRYGRRALVNHHDTSFDLACLGSMPALEVLRVKAVIGEYAQWEDYHIALFSGLSALTRLQALHVENGLITGLPSSVTELSIRYEDDELAIATFDGAYPYYSARISAFHDWCSSFQGTLSHLMLDMRLFQHSLFCLRSFQCVRRVPNLHLIFVVAMQTDLSDWCPGLLEQVQDLHLEFVGKYASPIWDLSTCTSLKKLTVSCSRSDSHWMNLGRVTGVTADLVELHLGHNNGRKDPGLDFTTWAMSKVDLYCGRGGFRRGLPACVTVTLSSLRRLPLVPMIMVNGLPAAAAEAAAEASAQAAALAAANWEAGYAAREAEYAARCAAERAGGKA